MRNKDASVGSPVELISGCQYNVFIPEDMEVYLVLPRPTSTSRLVYEFNWEGEMKQPMTLFSWSGQCCMSSHPHINIDTVAIYADWCAPPGEGGGGLLLGQRCFRFAAEFGFKQCVL